jgi:hypothetical protein
MSEYLQPRTYVYANSYPCTDLGRLLGLQVFETPRIPRQSARECSKVVSATHLPLLPQEIPLVLISVRG